MPVDRERVGGPSFEYARYQKSTFTTMSDGLVRAHVEHCVLCPPEVKAQAAKL